MKRNATLVKVATAIWMHYLWIEIPAIIAMVLGGLLFLALLLEGIFSAPALFVTVGGVMLIVASFKLNDWAHYEYYEGDYI